MRDMAKQEVSRKAIIQCCVSILREPLYASDLSSVLLLVVGSSGLAAWVLTYLQLRQERKRHAREYFRELILTPQLQGYLGALYSFCGILDETKSVQDVKLRAKELAELSGKIATAIMATIFQAAPYLCPEEFVEQLVKVDDLARQIGAQVLKGEFGDLEVRSKLEKESIKLGRLLRKMLGLSEFDRFSYKVRKLIRKDRYPESLRPTLGEMYRDVPVKNTNQKEALG
jgi:hypothetical protein